MQILALAIAGGATAGAALGEDAKAKEPFKGVSREEYSQRFPLTEGDSDAQKVISDCLALWPSHPFKNPKDRSFRTFAPTVNIIGLGGEIKDDVVTSYPQIILVKPSINVLTKTRFQLLNPNGWYCLRVNINVLSKNAIDLHCQAHIADSVAGFAVMGSHKDGTGRGVTVLGKSFVNKVGC